MYIGLNDFAQVYDGPWTCSGQKPGRPEADFTGSFELFDFGRSNDLNIIYDEFNSTIFGLCHFNVYVSTTNERACSRFLLNYILYIQTP